MAGSNSAILNTIDTVPDSTFPSFRAMGSFHTISDLENYEKKLKENKFKDGDIVTIDGDQVLMRYNGEWNNIATTAATTAINCPDYGVAYDRNIPPKHSRYIRHTSCNKCNAPLIMESKYRVNDQIYKCSYCDSLINIYEDEED